MAPRRCPCGTGLPYAECCGRLHDGTATAGTAEQLMRSRFSAFAVGDPAYLLRTWHSRTRPAALDLDPRVRWTALEVLATTGGGLLAAEGTVEFRAHSVVDRTAGSQHEDSRFVREDGGWRYLDGVALP
ncbi:YchJ family protein [Modestobacter versicolor]|uniref:YchJ family protein n=1 Tax=Modestobacter versicolor TaxID=429133 RepID=UPI0034E01C37